MDTHLPNDNKARLTRLYQEMEEKSLYPLWEVVSALVTPSPHSRTQAARWTFGAVRDYLMKAGDLISAHEAERRVLILENPGLPGTSGITTSLYAGLQLILPGEVAPCHRHAQAALRFVLEGEGAFTAVNGEKAIMRPFDLVLTPSWQWHDHGNSSTKPMIWLDGLDIQTVNIFDASFSEKFAEEAHPEAVPPDDSMSRYGRNLRPIRGSTADRRPPISPIFHYPYSDWRDSLGALAKAAAPDAHFGHALEFLNPANGGPIMPTIAAHVRLLPAGFETRPRRSTDGTIFVVVEGQGQCKIGDTEHMLGQGDVFVVPSWQPVTIAAATELVLFGYSDRASQESLGLFRESRM